VRNWTSTRDCFWTIAGWTWVYGDNYSWRVLYEANKQKIPDPNNPNLIEPGTVLDIPSLRGETRSGMWDPKGSNE
jgi:nucleoid-associated protein YgaU